MRIIIVSAAMQALAALAFAHGDVTPQPMDTAGLTPIGEQWLKDNPFRANKEQFDIAVKIGASGFNQNCARCHGLEVISGGLAPDLRYLDAGKEGDEWFMERIRNGYAQDGTTKMPKFEGVLSQEAMWAIRSYIETRPTE